MRDVAVEARDLEKGSYRMVHHGYRRPGYGQIVGDCFGVKFAPYEINDQCCRAWQNYEQGQAETYRARLADLEAGKVTQLVRIGHNWKQLDTLIAGVSAPELWYGLLEHEKMSLKFSIKHCEAEVERMEQMIKAWAPQELGTETRNSIEKRERSEARKAELAAKRVERAKRKEALANKRAVKAAALEVVKVALIQDLEALAERSDATDANQSSATRAEAYAILERHGKALRKAGLRLCLWDLKRGPLFAQLGLAEHRHPGDFYAYPMVSIGRR
jgi:hypothetical protein